MKPVRILAAIAAFAGAPVLAGTAEVRFAEPGRYADIGATHGEQVRNLEAIARHFDRLAQRLPANQVLRVEVVDVDLAGTQYALKPRVLRNMADIPRLHLRYSVNAGGQVLASGEDHLSRLDYAGGIRSARSEAALYDEKRLLDEWFAQRIAGPLHAAR